MKQPYERFVTLANKGARELGFADMGAMWRAKYDMAPDEFAREVDRLWEQVRPLYVSLHAYVRNRLREKYGDAVVPANGPIPAHLLGNMWAQEWEDIYPVVAPPNADPGYDLTEILKSRNTEPKQMVKYGESFFTSLGFAPLPDLLGAVAICEAPRSRSRVSRERLGHRCRGRPSHQDVHRHHAEDFTTIHHELGHNFYQRAYKHQPFLFRDSAKTGSTKPSATPSRFRLRPSIWSRSAC